MRGLFAWDRGGVLALQARGRRCVCLLDDAAARAHGPYFFAMGRLAW